MSYIDLHFFTLDTIEIFVPAYQRPFPEELTLEECTVNTVLFHHNCSKGKINTIIHIQRSVFHADPSHKIAKDAIVRKKITDSIINMTRFTHTRH